MYARGRCSLPSERRRTSQVRGFSQFLQTAHHTAWPSVHLRNTSCPHRQYAIFIQHQDGIQNLIFIDVLPHPKMKPASLDTLMLLILLVISSYVAAATVPIPQIRDVENPPNDRDDGWYVDCQPYVSANIASMTLTLLTCNLTGIGCQKWCSW